MEVKAMTFKEKMRLEKKKVAELHKTKGVKAYSPIVDLTPDYKVNKTYVVTKEELRLAIKANAFSLNTIKRECEDENTYNKILNAAIEEYRYGDEIDLIIAMKKKMQALKSK